MLLTAWKHGRMKPTQKIPFTIFPEVSKTSALHNITAREAFFSH